MPVRTRPKPRIGLDEWTSGYAPLPGIPDEFVGADGNPHPTWRRFLRALGEIPPAELGRRFASADRHIRDAGVSYRAYGEETERAWPLSHLPLLLGEAEWAAIAAGIEQRARLLEAVLADVYGEGRLVRDGHLPAAALAGSADFLRPMAGLKPPGGRWLHLYAADLGRGPDGRWWVLGDRTQAPSGAGYALENRLVLSRAFPDLYARLNVERLAPFFAAFRDGLAACAVRATPRIGLLTPGPYSQTYFEQAYLARYLGLLLVEGDDLVARDRRVDVRTVSGLKRVDVLWRRIDGDFADPLELNAASRLGVPGLLEAMRRNVVVVANAPGSGVIESRSLLGFLPVLCRQLLGEDLRLPNIATWWCGEPGARKAAAARLRELAFEPAYRAAGSGPSGNGGLLGPELDRAGRARLAGLLEARGIDWVAQEIVRLSTTPVWEGGALVPRPFTLRVFAAATPDGWRVMPGGFCRIAEEPDARAVAMAEGTRSADVWVLSERPVAPVSLLPSADQVQVRRIPGHLPSRAADNLFWLGRYLERAEALLRVVRALCSRLPERGPASFDASPAAETLRALLVEWKAAAETVETRAEAALGAIRGAERPGSVLSAVLSAQRAAAGLRERLSPDAWHLIRRLRALVEGGAAGRDAGLTDPDIVELVEAALGLLAAFAGLSHENMNRAAGWRFLEMGRRTERGVNTCRLARALAGAGPVAGNLDTLLDLVDCQITYHSRYLVGLAPAPVKDLVVLDPYNPRSVAFQVGALADHLANLPPIREDGLMEMPRRLVMALEADLARQEAEAIGAPVLLDVERRLMDLAEAIGTCYFPHGPHAARAENLFALA
ncbi:MAG TPA: circularly permuted type 2 ATP-grasp protein [Beijerinckiaceae bacterium]|nr:circularly permuted type 2 ATP-grasp protein [Beijerinckiaceae bacterium]